MQLHSHSLFSHLALVTYMKSLLSIRPPASGDHSIFREQNSPTTRWSNLTAIMPMKRLILLLRMAWPVKKAKVSSTRRDVRWLPHRTLRFWQSCCSCVRAFQIYQLWASFPISIHAAGRRIPFSLSLYTVSSLISLSLGVCSTKNHDILCLPDLSTKIYFYCRQLYWRLCQSL